jgi:hypothetical protein
MEFMLLLWDEWDDFTGACQHLVASTADEMTGLRTSAVGMWVAAIFSSVSVLFR